VRTAHPCFMVALVIGGVSLIGDGVSAFRISGPVWAPPTITMQLQLGSSSGTLINGCPSWGCAAELALGDWNLFLNRSQFNVVRDSGAPRADSSGANNVFFSSSIYGDPWDADTLAITLLQFSGGLLFETDVLFNTNFNWNAYDGPLRRASAGGRLQDFQRVALHEFGHVLGLDHPDEIGQRVSAIMNSTIGDTDTLQFDDILGAYALYLGTISGASMPFPPRNETLSFRTELENKYRTGLRRPVGATYADPEGSVVWTQEYLRYRMSACRSDQSIARIAVQIAGGGVQPVCGIAPATLSFPPRNETLGFRQALEDVYRVDLGRMPTPTAVDVEGDVVWIQEYIRYRLTGCNNTQATTRVLQQIDGFGVQPTCG
jgi:Matrixin